MKKLLIISCIFLSLSAIAAAQTKQPKTVRDFFMLLPEKYFSTDCCIEKNYQKAKAEYLKKYLKIEDTANGYLSGEGDAAQEGFEMALFKQSGGNYLIAFYTRGEGGIEDYPWCVFLEYKGGKWFEKSKSVVPNYDPIKLAYKLPRKGTTIEVFQKDENGEDFYKGKKLYDLNWNGVRFSIKK